MIKTERLSIRRVCAEDWKAIQAIWVEVSKTMYAQYDTPKDVSDASVKPRIEKWASFACSTEHIFFAVCFDELVIGYVSLNEREYGYELGYCFHPDFHGKGYARESISNILEYMKTQGGDCIRARTALKNHPSVHLLLKLGFCLVGTEKVSFYQDVMGQDIVFDGGIYEIRQI